MTEPVQRTAESLTLKPGQRAWYLDAYGKQTWCTVTSDEGPDGAVYIKIDGRNGECWFDSWERGRLVLVSRPQKPTVQP